MKKTILLLIATACVSSAFGTYWHSAPSSANNGESYNMTAKLNAGQLYETSILLFRNGSYVAYGSGWNFGYGNATVTYTRSETGAQIVNYRADGYWTYYDFEGIPWTESNSIYHSITIIAPNQAPTASLSLNKSSAVVGESVTVSFTISDADGNYDYANLWVHTPAYGWRWIRTDNSLANGGSLDRNQSATAYGTAGSHTRSFTFTLDQGFGTYTFALAAVDTAGARGDATNQTVTVANRAPAVSPLSINGTTFNQGGIVSGPPIVVEFGQSVTITSVATDADGNGASHHFIHDGGNATYWYSPQPGSSYPVENNGWSAVTPTSTFASSGSYSATFQPQFVPTQGFFRLGGRASDSSSAAVTNHGTVTVNKALPSVSFPAAEFWPAVGGYIVQAADLNAVFFNPHSGGVSGPSGNVSYSIVLGGSGSVAANTSLNGGTYVIRATIEDDANYLSRSFDAEWRVHVPPNDADNDGIPDDVEAQLGRLNTANIAEPDTTNSNQLKIHRPNP